MRLLVTTALAFGVLEVVTGLMPSYWSFLALLVPTGLALLMFTTTANSATQLGTTPAVRGRVMGLYMLVFLGGAPLGSPLVGWVAEQFGPRMSLIAGGVISAATAVVAAMVLARRRGVPGPQLPPRADGQRGRTRAARSGRGRPQGCYQWRMRLFVAIALPASAAGELDSAVAPLRLAWPELRWTGQDAWHLTLAFLGEVDEKVTGKLTVRLGRAAARHPRLPLSLGGAGAFPGPAGPGCCGPGYRAIVAGLSALADSVAGGRQQGRGAASLPGPPVRAAPDPGPLPGARGRADPGCHAWPASRAPAGRPRRST